MSVTDKTVKQVIEPGNSNNNAKSEGSSKMLKFAKNQVNTNLSGVLQEQTNLVGAKHPKFFENETINLSKFIKDYDNYLHLSSPSKDKIFNSIKPAMMSTLASKAKRNKTEIENCVAKKGEEETAIVTDNLVNTRPSTEASGSKDLVDYQLTDIEIGNNTPPTIEEEIVLMLETPLIHSHQEADLPNTAVESDVTQSLTLKTPPSQDQPKIEYKRCFACRKYGHIARNCPKTQNKPQPPSPCRKCGGWHWMNECHSSSGRIQQYQQMNRKIYKGERNNYRHNNRGRRREPSRSPLLPSPSNNDRHKLSKRTGPNQILKHTQPAEVTQLTAEIACQTDITYPAIGNAGSS